MNVVVCTKAVTSFNKNSIIDTWHGLSNTSLPTER